MRNGTNPRKSRGRNNNSRRNNNPNNNGSYRPQTVFESNGPEGKIRGNAQQIYEKYIALATDAAMSDDNVRSEGFYQHAEHYLRLMLHDTDIEYDVYRQQQQQRRENLINGISDADSNAEKSNDFESDVEVLAEAEEKSSKPAPRKSTAKEPTDDRMIDPPGFLSAGAPVKKKEIKIEAAKQPELEAEPA